MRRNCESVAAWFSSEPSGNKEALWFSLTRNKKQQLHLMFWNILMSITYFCFLPLWKRIPLQSPVSCTRWNVDVWKQTYSTAAIWSWTSTVPSLWWTSCRILWPWKPLPRPSRRATMTLSELTSTESQLTEKRSLTAWPPGALSLHRAQNMHSPSVSFNLFVRRQGAVAPNCYTDESQLLSFVRQEVGVVVCYLCCNTFLSPSATWRLTEVFQNILKESTMYGREDEDETGFDTNITSVRRIESLLVSFVDSYKDANYHQPLNVKMCCHLSFFQLSSDWFRRQCLQMSTPSGCLGVDALNASYIAAGWKHHAEVLWDISFSVRTNTYWSCGKHFRHILWYIHQQQQSVVAGIREVWWVGDLQR